MAKIGLIHLDYEMRMRHPHLLLARTGDASKYHLRSRGSVHPCCASGERLLPVYPHNAVADESQLCPNCFSAYKREVKTAIADTEQPTEG